MNYVLFHSQQRLSRCISLLCDLINCFKKLNDETKFNEVKISFKKGQNERNILFQDLKLYWNFSRKDREDTELIS